MTKIFEDDLVLEESKIFEESIKVKGDIRCENTLYNLTVKGCIDAENIDAWDIDAENIDAWNIDAWNIDARDIDAENIHAGDIHAGNIDAWNIDAWNIHAEDIDAWNIDAWNIDAWNIHARDISFYAYCISRKSLKCRSITGRRKNSLYKCLDQEIEYVEERPLNKGEEEE